MPATPLPPLPGLDDIYLARPLVLAAALIIAGHLLRGSAPAPAASRPHQEEVSRHA